MQEDKEKSQGTYYAVFFYLFNPLGLSKTLGMDRKII